MGERGFGTRLLSAASILAGAALAVTSTATHSLNGERCSPGGLKPRTGWTRISAARGYQLEALAFRSGCDGVLVGAHVASDGKPGTGAILTTTNGGRTLRPVPIPTAVGPLLGLAVVGRDAWAVGSNGEHGVILKSLDGGQSWRAEHLLAHAGHLAGVFFLDSNDGWAVGTDTILRTQNGGSSWTKTATTSGTSLRAVEFANQRLGWAVGTINNAATVLASSNGGRSWKQSFSAPGGAILTTLEVLSPARVFAAGSENPKTATALLIARVDGHGWQRLSTRQLEDVAGLHFATQSRGWISASAGLGAEILQTRDGGHRWQVRFKRDTLGAGPLTFHGLEDAWMIGSFGLFATTDADAT